MLATLCIKREQMLADKQHIDITSKGACVRVYVDKQDIVGCPMQMVTDKREKKNGAFLVGDEGAGISNLYFSYPNLN